MLNAKRIKKSIILLQFAYRYYWFCLGNYSYFTPEYKNTLCFMSKFNIITF